ncbi:hypothetical protein P153DRAFT_110937 [Dothidotthia symphoricarpi CBS 119687]|uniref:Uncharacterized protein n=1 Tax=Dothidotthia symphoricarpi CBS 119687 TaxID=1392245 RepID=A0A6A6A281_9PLEO|nr:uncharacterized protein P153DRAFT_110937 [Dothidotthia symphoricarpi CBS 119687]KAF2125283.1 hypothetical protein P153DRAFT_110937 [Dothidotthia symphoricarpi CBS 119687]
MWNCQFLSKLVSVGTFGAKGGLCALWWSGMFSQAAPSAAEPWLGPIPDYTSGALLCRVLRSTVLRVRLAVKGNSDCALRAQPR